MKIGSVLAATLLLVVSMTAQEDAPLARRFEMAMRAASPQARLVPLPPSQSEGVRYRLWSVPDQGNIDVRYYVFQYEDSAAGFLRAQPQLLSAPTAPVQKLGDEAFVTVLSGVKGQTITFRRGRVIVSVRAPGDSNNLRVARVLVTEIDRSVAAGDLDASFYHWQDPR